IIDSYTSLVNPERKITPYVVKLTGITDDMVASAPTFAEIADKVSHFTENAVFVAHNIGFDYGVIRREFRRLEKGFRRNNVCTVKLSQKTFKDQPSYSLGTLCQNLNLVLEARHRAYGDAEATALLLHKIIEEKGKDFVMEATSQQAIKNDITANIPHETIENLPEDPGVCRFLDKEGNILMVKSGKNLYKEMRKFLAEDINTFRYENMAKEVTDIQTEVINSYVISQLKEIELIRQEKPAYNKKTIAKSLPVGVFWEQEPKHNLFFDVERNLNENALWRFQHEKSAKKFLKGFLQKNQLQVLPAQNTIQQYKKQVMKALQKNLYPHQNFFMIREVAFVNTAYIVWIENFVFKGVGEIELDTFDNSIETLKDSITTFENNAESTKIIQRYIRKRKTVKIVAYH
ncbi:MAG: exonuclease domain-containing protein, partial [Chitinophagales bacterium]